MIFSKDKSLAKYVVFVNVCMILSACSLTNESMCTVSILGDDSFAGSEVYVDGKKIAVLEKYFTDPIVKPKVFSLPKGKHTIEILLNACAIERRELVVAKPSEHYIFLHEQDIAKRYCKETAMRLMTC